VLLYGLARPSMQPQADRLSAPACPRCPPRGSKRLPRKSVRPACR